MDDLNNAMSVSEVPVTIPVPPAPVAPVELRPGMVVMVKGEPEVVYHYNARTMAYQTHKGQRYQNHEKYEVVDRPDVIPAVRQENPTRLAQHLNLPVSLTLGADPEVFMVDGKGVVLPAFAYLGKKPEFTPTITDYTPEKAVKSFYDGFQAEFTIPPQSCLGYTTDYIRIGLGQVRDAGRALDPEARLVVDGVLEIPYDMRQAVDPQHLQLGCAPSRNAYGEPPMAVPAPEDLDIRFAGSHMHFGLETPERSKYNRIKTVDGIYMTDEIVVRTVRLLDAILGVAMVSFGEGVQHPARRQYYGRAGEYRYNGNESRLEYRVPDVNLIAHPATMNLLWEVGRVVVRLGFLGMGFLWDAEPEEVRGIVNEYDVPAARAVLARNANILRTILTKTERSQSRDWGAGPEWTEMGMRALEHGIGAVVRDPKDLVENWWLDHPTQQRVDGFGPDQPLPTPDMWWYEAYQRRHANWPAGRIWSSAAKLIAKGELV